MLGYVGRHWRGDLSLPQSYWVNGVLIGLPYNIYVRVVGEVFRENHLHSPSDYFFWVVLPFLAYLPLLTWQLVGIWRSAGRRISDGRPAWAWIARIVIVVNLVVLATTFISNVKTNYSLVNAYFEERAARFEVEGHGNYAILHGEITDAAADQLEPLLKAPHMSRLVINGSNGGFVLPTLRLAKVIHDRKLMVVAIGECDSACTGLIAAADVRAINPDTICGFHRGTMAGLNDTAEGWNKVEDYYKSAGMSPKLLDKVRQHHGPRDLYEPKMRELIETGFITDIYDPGITHFVSSRDWCASHAVQCDRTGRQNAAAQPKAGRSAR